ncbi:MAG: DMT family transporter [Anaerolineales bacterium]|nr:MAG: DMT family transporter [Anaerolineales bacterium]
MMIYVKLLLMAVFWGGTFIAGRIISRDVEPFSAAFSRFFIASIFLLVLTWRLEGKLPSIKKSQVIPIILLGMTGIFGYNVFFFNGLKTVTAGRASLIVATNPIFISALSSLLFKERLSLIKVVGIFISVSGAIIVITTGNLTQIWNGSLGWGELYIFGCVLSWVAYSLIGKAILAELSPLISVSYSSVAGTVALLVPAYLEGVTQKFSHYPESSWLGFVYLALFGSVLGFRWYYEGIKKIGPMKASIFINFVPISATVLAFLILGEPITLSLLVGAILVGSGVYLTNSTSRRASYGHT